LNHYPGAEHLPAAGVAINDNLFTMRKMPGFKLGMLLKFSLIFLKSRDFRQYTAISLIALICCTMQSCKNGYDKASKRPDSTIKTRSPSLLPKIVYINTDEVDDEFAWKASNQKISELEMSRLALSKGHDKKVRLLGRLTTNGDSVANQMLGNLAADRRILLLDGLEKNEQKILDNLKRKRGKDFDKTYVVAMIAAYNKDRLLFEEATRNLKDTALKHFALQALPAIKSNLSNCKQVNGQLK
jgi:putative membrane protein